MLVLHVITARRSFVFGSSQHQRTRLQVSVFVLLLASLLNRLLFLLFVRLFLLSFKSACKLPMHLVIVYLLHFFRALVLSDQLKKHCTTCAALITEICRGGGACI